MRASGPVDRLRLGALADEGADGRADVARLPALTRVLVRSVPPAFFESVLLSRPAVRHANATNRGYLVCDVTHGQVDASFRIVDALVPSSTATTNTVISIPAEA